MKVEHTNQQPEFQPIELKITIESAEELKRLYGATNTNPREFGYGSFSKEVSITGTIDNTLFSTLYDIAEKRGYIK